MRGDNIIKSFVIIVILFRESLFSKNSLVLLRLMSFAFSMSSVTALYNFVKYNILTESEREKE